MKKTKKRIVSISMAICLMSLCACGSTAQVQTDPGNTDASQVSSETAQNVSENKGSSETADVAEQTASESGEAASDNEEKLQKELLDKYNITLDDLLEPYNAKEDLYTWEGHSYEVEKKALPIYYYSPDKKDSIDLYFMDGEMGIPYISPDDAAAVLEYCSQNLFGNTDYRVFVHKDGAKVYFIRETAFATLIDFEEDLIKYVDYDGFTVPSMNATLIDIISATSFFGAGKEEKYVKIEDSSYNRFGHVVDINTRDYGIDMIYQDGKHYIPLQVFSDFFMSIGLNISLLYNGGTVFGVLGGESSLLKDVLDEGKADYSSAALNKFNYYELCMVLDTFYGLKEQHDITKFDDFIYEIGLKHKFFEDDPTSSDQALYDLLIAHLDDTHCNFKKKSFFADLDKMNQYTGTSTSDMAENLKRYAGSRSKYYPDGVPAYEEVGDTAYITFDNFTLSVNDYYTTGIDDSFADTTGIMLYAVSQIKREGSPIKNVVIDLSANIGGTLTSATFTIGAMIGKGNICVKNTLSGGMSRQNFIADTNLDKKFEDNEGLSDYNLFCLISPVSFSAGNLVPSVLKYSDKATILGKTSGGGTCSVAFFSNAKGGIYGISSPFQMSFMKNGSFYDIDKGIEPDYTIATPDLFYDREYVNKYIHEILDDK